MAKADVFATPWPGIHATRIDSARHYPRHSHATYGFGVIERGAQRSASGRGQVDAHAGDVITNNPGEVHDGKPIGDGGRLWRMLHLEPAMFAATLGDADADRASLEIALTRPVIQDRALRHALRRLLARIDDWNAAGALRAGEALACDDEIQRRVPEFHRRLDVIALAGCEVLERRGVVLCLRRGRRQKRVQQKRTNRQRSRRIHDFTFRWN